MAAMLLSPMAAFAQPDLSQKLGPTIADKGSAFYRFERFTLASPDGQRHYKIQVGIPKRAAPATGYPAACLLDGNAAMAAIDEGLLQTLDAAEPPVIIAIGYDTELRFDVNARAYDYTPPFPADQPDEEGARGRKGGGADTFLALITQTILPRVRKMVAIDDHRLTLWGHSYGGLFTLHTLFTQPPLFQRYVAASPSLGWQRAVILDEEKRFAQTWQAAGKPAVRLWVMAGDSEQRRERPAAVSGDGAASAPNAQTQAVMTARAAMPRDATPKMVARLSEEAGLTASFHLFPGMSHGPMLPASLGPALRIAAGLPPFEGGRDHP